MRRYLDDFRPRDAVTDNLFCRPRRWTAHPDAVHCVLPRLKKKCGLKKLTAHQCRGIWATNFRRTGTGDLFELQQLAGWEDLDVPRRFYVDVGPPQAGQTSVRDRWTVERKRRPWTPAAR
jgi:hypothetical protein